LCGGTEESPGRASICRNVGNSGLPLGWAAACELRTIGITRDLVLLASNGKLQDAQSFTRLTDFLEEL